MLDNLHERAGSTEVIHLHGELTKVTSSFQPNNPRFIKELKPEEYEVRMGDKAPDGSQFRPFIVWFGEAVPMIETAIDYVDKSGYICDSRYFAECLSRCRFAETMYIPGYQSI